jgi:metallo-beta-lactamase family protein
MQITFCGAAESVTGSCHLVNTQGEDAVSFLLDCGQFQGSARHEAQNFEPFPFDPAGIDFMILSHAHIDHCGRIPVLAKQGFQGPIYCTATTADLLPIMLRDAAYIQEKEAEWKNRKGQRSGKEPVTPLFSMAEAEESLALISPVLFDQEICPAAGIRFSFADAGHILGSAITQIWIKENGHETKVVYSGDLGVDSMPLLRDPVRIRHADVLVMETTYGARVREKHGPSLERLYGIIEKTIKRGGTVVIPSFAVGRTQELIYELNGFYEGKGKDTLPFRGVKVYIDSPMASAATEVFRKNVQDFDSDFKALVLAGDDPLDFEKLVFTRDVEESKALNADTEPKIIISASGMCDAGRILHHLKHNLWNPKSSIVFVGYQSEGTLGRRLVEGVKTVSLFGESIDVNAEIISLEGFSAHADRDGLLDWVRGFDNPPGMIFLVHGEAEAKTAFAGLLRDELDINPIAIQEFSTWSFGGNGDVAGVAGAADGANGVAGADGKAGAAGKDGVIISSNGMAYAGIKTIQGGEKPVDPEDMERLLGRLSSVNENLEGLLYRAKLATLEAANNGDAESYTAIKNLITSLDSDTSKLAGELVGKKEQG